jgi:hypothetical protein
VKKNKKALRNKNRISFCETEVISSTLSRGQISRAWRRGKSYWSSARFNSSSASLRAGMRGSIECQHTCPRNVRLNTNNTLPSTIGWTDGHQSANPHQLFVIWSFISGTSVESYRYRSNNNQLTVWLVYSQYKSPHLLRSFGTFKEFNSKVKIQKSSFTLTEVSSYY